MEASLIYRMELKIKKKTEKAGGTKNSIDMLRKKRSGQ